MDASRQVEEGAGHGGDRYPVVHRAVVRWQESGVVGGGEARRAMGVTLLTAEVKGAFGEAGQAPQRRGGGVGDQCTAAGIEDGDDAALAEGPGCAGEAQHPRGHRLPGPGGRPPPLGGPMDPEMAKLGSTHHAVLSLGQGTDRFHEL